MKDELNNAVMSGVLAFVAVVVATFAIGIALYRIVQVF